MYLSVLMLVNKTMVQCLFMLLLLLRDAGCLSSVETWADDVIGRNANPIQHFCV